LDVLGVYDLYGTRFNTNKEVEIIPLGNYGDLIAVNNDSYANELFEKLKVIFPDPHEYLY